MKHTVSRLHFAPSLFFYFHFFNLFLNYGPCGGQIFSLAQLKGSLALELGIVKIMYVSSTLMLAALF